LTHRAQTGIYAAIRDIIKEHHRPMQQVMQPQVEKSALDGLWVLLVDNEGQLTTADPDGRVPMMARAGDDQTYLLGFKNVSNARRFLATSDVAAEPRMVVRGNRSEMLRIAQAAGVAGVLVDYDPQTQQYGAATSLY
jgi:hypothetical protein